MKPEEKLLALLTRVLQDTCALHEHMGACEACDRRLEALWKALFDNRKMVRKALSVNPSGS